MKRNVLLALLITSFSSSTFAKQLTLQEAICRLDICKDAKRRNAGALSKVRNYKLSYTSKKGNDNLMYVLNDADAHRFVIISADDVAPAILAYGSSTFDVASLPSNAKAWFEGMECAIGDLIGSNSETKQRVVTSTYVIEPLIKTKWSQDTPFSNLCAEKTGEEVVAGCIATSMAQIMNYYQYPAYGIGSKTYTTEAFAFKLSADFTKPFEWSNICDFYGPYYPDGEDRAINANYTDTQAKAVADLVYRCGVAADMDYGVGGSGSTDVKCATAFINTFGYDKGIKLVRRSYYTDEEWESMMIDELANGHPLIYSGSTATGNSHGFICDGYDGDGYFHFNWGWAGYADGYYLVSGMNSMNPPVDLTYDGKYGFVRTQTMITGIQPAVSGTKDALFFSAPEGYIVTSSPTFEGTYVATCYRSNTAFLVGGFYNEGLSDTDVALGVKFVNRTSGEEYIDFVNAFDNISINTGVAAIPFTPASVEKNGSYDVYPIYAPKGCDYLDSDNWTVMQMPLSGATYLPQPLEVAGEEPVVALTQAYVNREDNVTTAEDFVLKMKVKALENFTNHQVVAWVYAEGNVSSATYALAVLSMSKGETKELSVKLTRGAETIVAGGKYNVRITDQTLGYTLAPSVISSFDVSVVSRYEDGGADVISVSRNDCVGVPVYALDGRRVDVKNLPAGIYVRNGKKYLVK